MADKFLVNSAFVERRRLLVQGVVQGVGFRPFVHALATRLELAGLVGNDGAGVFIEVEGPPAVLATFQHNLVAHPPVLAHVEQITSTTVPITGERAFHIVHSQANAAASTLISPDLALCDDCLRELFDPHDRRFRYPFINCTNCGPRFTIIRDIPYDRPYTTMAGFRMCEECRREYEDPGNRRFHAQPNACPNCGPQLTFYWAHDTIPSYLSSSFAPTVQPAHHEHALRLAQQVLAQGGIVAIKGIGGYHLACDALDEQAVQTLRQRKGRADKPFALMARALDAVRCIAHVDDTELALLTSRERPIVLLKKGENSPLAASVAPGNPCVGVMLPYSPLHYLLFAPVDAAHSPRVSPLLVMTSGNYSDEPIVKDNDEALARLADLADAFLVHDRAIHVPCDDSVIRVFEGKQLPIRRSRGYAPFPVKLPFAVRPALAVGGELKSTFCVTKGSHAFLSQHIGDMQKLETLQTFAHAVAHMQSLFRIAPEVVACDLHPGYLSTRWAEEYAGERPLVKVQHHHAHIAAVMAEQGLDGRAPVIGFSFDGTGYGTDGAIWGGEVLIADYRRFRRAAHLQYFPLPGGDAAIRRPYRTALAALWAAGVEWAEELPPVAAIPPTERGVLQRQLETGLAAVPTSSMGRLFDAVAALIGVRQRVNYEAQAAIELEALVDENTTDGYHFGLPTAIGSSFDATPVVQAVAADVLAGVAPGVIAARFHNAVADLILEISLWLRRCEGFNEVALSGGVFQNLVLLRRVIERLRAANFAVLTHRLTPPNDGGLALGQAAIASWADVDRHG
jgi:hydrogenase maturation protein HypF